MNDETNHNPGGAKPRPLVLTESQMELADKLRAICCPWFDQSEYTEIPLAHGFIDCMAIAIERAGQDDLDAMKLAYMWAYNYFIRLSKAEKDDAVNIAEPDDGETPPF